MNPPRTFHQLVAFGLIRRMIKSIPPVRRPVDRGGISHLGHVWIGVGRIRVLACYQSTKGT